MSSLFDINNRAPVSVHITYRSITMATPTDISDVTTAYSSLIGKTFAGTYKESKNMGLTTDGSGSTRRLVISIDEANVDSAMIETLHKKFETCTKALYGKALCGMINTIVTHCTSGNLISMQI